ncbi:MAG: tRNA (adenosine(37)-N6)-dimethylallyltransferase MiaA [Candidatus Kerfeldbacteria bacterium]|jgi:tRNA dimethylallyltransferase
MKINNKPLLIVIVGPNASGKTSLSIKLAKKFNGEIISADSRQVYKNMDIGTGKVTKQEQQTIQHYLIDVASPNKEYNVSHFKKDTLKALKKIYIQNKLPFLVGGTGFWIQAIIDDINLPAVKPNKKLRKQLGNKNSVQLFNILKKLDPSRAKNIDAKNPFRLIRAIEIVKATKKPIAKIKKKDIYNLLVLGIKHPKNIIQNRINKRLTIRLKQGMISEVKKLHKQGVSWKRMETIGLEYKFISSYLRNNITKQEMKDKIKTSSYKYAKRQLTWFNKDDRINWITSQKEAIKLTNKFIKQYANNN